MNNQLSGMRYYQSANADTASIKDDFIIRIEEYEIIMDDIRRNPMQGSVQHYLLLGRRGSGKSTVLKRLQVELESDPVLKETYIPINLAEEQANIYRLYDLLNEIITELKEKGIDVDEPEDDEDCNNYSRNLFQAIHEAITKAGKKIVLLLDNIDRIFENMGDDQGMVREILLNYDDVKIVGGSTKMTEHFWSYDQPFYQFFRVLTLKPLTRQEIESLLLKWSEKLNLPQLKEFVEKRSGQLETVRILTDGLPRTLQFFINVLINHTEETGYEYLRMIMDHVSPLYQERLNTLPPAHRKIVLQMAFIWEGTGTKEIAAATHMESKLISAYLKQLVDNGIAEKIDTGTRNHLYRLSERFFNLWLIFTQGNPKEKRKAKCLTIFLENFYDSDGLQNLANNHLKLLTEGRLSADKAAMITKALAQSRYISSAMRDELIDNTLLLGNIAEDARRQMPQKIIDIADEVNVLIEKKQWEKAMKLAKTIEQEDGIKEVMIGEILLAENDFVSAESYLLQAIKKGHDVFNDLGVAYYHQDKLDEAENCYLKAVKSEEGGSLHNLGLLYVRKGELEYAKEWFLKALDKGEIKSIANLAVIYDKEGNVELAEKYFLLDIKKESGAAFNNLGLFYFRNGNNDLAEKYYLMAFEKGVKEVAYNMGLLYVAQKQLEKAESFFILAIEKGDYFANLNLGALYQDQGRMTLAEKYYLTAAEHGVVGSMTNLGSIYSQQGNNKLATEWYLKGVKKGEITAAENLAILNYRLGVNKEQSLELIDGVKAEINRDSVITLWIVINVWNGKYDDIYDELKALIGKGLNNFVWATIVHLLIHRQINMVNNLFNDKDFGKDLIESYQAVFYVTQFLLNTNISLALKIPPELNQTIDDLLQEIRKGRLLYYGEEKV